ncbi:unnamed protein product [Closterium sp. NIES-53]
MYGAHVAVTITTFPVTVVVTDHRLQVRPSTRPLPPVSAAATVPSITTTAAALAACTFSLLAAFSSPHRLLLRLRVQLYLLLAVAAAALHTESPFSSLTPTLTHIVRPLPTASASVTLAATSVTTAAAAAAAAITAEALTERNLLA